MCAKFIVFLAYIRQFIEQQKKSLDPTILYVQMKQQETLQF